MNSVLAALLAVCLYYVGAAFFNAAVARMEPLQGTRPVHLVRHAVRDPGWLTGLFLFVIGLELQLIAFADLPLGLAQTLFAAALPALLVIGLGYFGESLCPREWRGLFLFALGELLILVSVLPDDDIIRRLPSTPALLALAVPTFVVAPLLFWLSGRSRPGRHARARTGTAYGICIGILVGFGETGLKGLALINGTYASGLGLLSEPYPYVIGVSLLLCMAITTVALQRRRMVICLAVCTIVAKTYLVVAGMLLYGEYPADPGWMLLRLAGVAVAIGALFSFPLYDGGRNSSATTSSAVSTAGSVPPR